MNTQIMLVQNFRRIQTLWALISVFRIWVISMSCQHMEVGLEICSRGYFWLSQKLWKKNTLQQDEATGDASDTKSRRGLMQKGGLGWLETDLSALEMAFSEWSGRKLVFISNNDNSTVVHVNSIPSCVLGSWQHQYTRTIPSQESTLHFKSREIKPKKGFH